MGNQGMMFGGNDPVTSTQVTIPKDVSILLLTYHKCLVTILKDIGSLWLKSHKCFVTIGKE